LAQLRFSAQPRPPPFIPSRPALPIPIGLRPPDRPSLPRLAFFFLRTKPTEPHRPLAPHHAGRCPLPLPKWPEHSPLITSHHPADPLVKRLIMELNYATASRPAVTPPLSSPALPFPPPPLGRSGRKPSSGELPRAAMAAGPWWTGRPAVHSPLDRVHEFFRPNFFPENLIF
jgi:hypothetical protein